MRLLKKNPPNPIALKHVFYRSKPSVHDRYQDTRDPSTSNHSIAMRVEGLILKMAIEFNLDTPSPLPT
jgi:hypothetical protein